MEAGADTGLVSGHGDRAPVVRGYQGRAHWVFRRRLAVERIPE